MKDYLTNILDRSFSVEPAIRPRLVSFFEPPRIDMPVFEREVEVEPAVPKKARAERRVEIDDVLFETPHVSRRVEEGRLVEPTPRHFAESPAQLDHAAPPSDLPAVTPATQPHAPLLTTDDQKSASKETRVVERIIERVKEPVRVESHTQPSLNVIPALTEQPPKVVRSEVAFDNDRSTEKSLVQSRVPVQTSPPEINRHADLRIHMQLNEADQPASHQPEVTKQPVAPTVTRNVIEMRETHLLTNPSPPAPAKPTAPRSIQPVSVTPARLPRVSEADEAKHEPRNEPTIQVTIGRVEVRAVTSNEVPKSQRPKPAPLMSLDDYLRQRAEGSKR